MHPHTVMLLGLSLGDATLAGAVALQRQTLPYSPTGGEGWRQCAIAKEDGQEYSPIVNAASKLKELGRSGGAEAAGNSSYTPRKYADFIPCPPLAAMYNAEFLNPKFKGREPETDDEWLMSTVPYDELKHAIMNFGVTSGLADQLVQLLTKHNRDPFPLFRMLQFPELRHRFASFSRYTLVDGDQCEPKSVGFKEKVFDKMLASKDANKDGHLDTAELATVIGGLKPSSPDGGVIGHYAAFGIIATSMQLNIETLRLLYKGFFPNDLLVKYKEDAAKHPKQHKKKLFACTSTPGMLCKAFILKVCGSVR